jgi:C-terminal processing protease CtpA/Prc
MLKTLTRLAAAAGLLCASMSHALIAQGPPPGPDMTIDRAVRTTVLDGVAKELKGFYVFPDVATQMAEAVQQRRERGEYDTITSASTLADTLTTHLREVSHDKHLRVNYSSTVLPSFQEKVERLAGNIGYLDLRGFMPPEVMGDTAAAAMSFLSNTAALIIDLRQNGGGSPEAVSLMASYLFNRPVRLNDIYDRPSNETRQFWTQPYVPGKRFVDKDVYVLTSSMTFSAAEDFTYGLKNLKRAIIVGEVTGGGAHPVGPRRLSDHFVVVVPMGRSISSITKADWEGTGVEPDIKVPATQAIHTAYLQALDKRAASVSEPPMKAEIARAIEDTKKILESNPGR